MKYLFLIGIILSGTIGFSSCREFGDDHSQDTNDSLTTILQGDWMDSWSLTMEYQLEGLLFDPDSEIWFRGYYDPWSMEPQPGFGIRFTNKGDFFWTVVASVGTGGCRVYTAEYVKGQVTAIGSTLFFYPEIRRLKHHSSCNPENNLDRNESTGSFSLQFSVKQTADSSGRIYEVLTLIFPDGQETEYIRIKS
ncbi:hypothetical protein ACE1ET_00445 [Saccharicrinis sp. FJH62]|uniref:hypothetical protein n=1 Tax=Saccharicrinis sp. FJH62 TaxID=3344657 RepID=UPI0035D42A20